MKAFIAVAVPVAFASEDAMLDDGLSLLQMRAQPHKEAQEPKYYLGPRGGDCPPNEDIDYSQCLEAQVKKLIPNTIAAHGLLFNQRGGGYHQRACFVVSGSIYFSDEPVGGKLGGNARNVQPICAKSGGGFEAFIADGKTSCKEADCTHKPSNMHMMNWGEGGTYVPEIQILGAGELCDPCGILSYAQCSKAGDMGLIEAVYGTAITSEHSTQCSGAGHTRPAMPSGCSVHARSSYQAMFCPYDTPDGKLAGLVSDSGAGVSYGGARPVCGVCTTTTTTPEPPAADPAADMGNEADQADAVADPHMTIYPSGKHYDITDQ